MIWQLAEAKNQLSEVVRRALDDEPQIIARRDAEVVVMSKARYEELMGKTPSFLEFLVSEGGPSLEGIDLERSTDPMRDVKL